MMADAELTSNIYETAADLDSVRFHPEFITD